MVYQVKEIAIYTYVLAYTVRLIIASLARLHAALNSSQYMVSQAYW